MAGSELTDLTPAVVGDLDDDTLFYIVADPAGSPADKSLALSVLRQRLTADLSATYGGAGVIVPPLATLSDPNPSAWWGAERASFLLFPVNEPTPFRWMTFRIGVASGNIQVGVSRVWPSPVIDRMAQEVVATSGVIACPDPGDIFIDLGQHTATKGLWGLWFWADNTTVTVPWSTTPTTYRLGGSTGQRAGGVVSSETGGNLGQRIATNDSRVLRHFTLTNYPRQAV